jgi:ABC-type glycerol-3-phosphate transport system permease component
LGFLSAGAGVLTRSGTQGTPLHLVMVLTTVMIIPIVIVFFVPQKRFIEGLTSAGIKG